MIAHYIELTKPRIMLLIVFSGLTALFVEGEFLKNNLLLSVLILFALYLTGGCANALNQYFERHIDAKMSRTNKRRPLPMGIITPSSALAFSISIGLIGVFIFGYVFNLLSAFLSLATILFYSLFYTLYLKPNTPQNIVIGGIAGSMPPVIVWAAVRGDVMDIVPWALFFIIFLWTPPHFWILALYFKEDYKISGLPMLPVIKNQHDTLKIIFIYTIILVIFTLAFAITQGVFYIIVSLILNTILILKSYNVLKDMSRSLQKNLFLYSLIYLFTLFSALIIENTIF